MIVTVVDGKKLKADRAKAASLVRDLKLVLKFNSNTKSMNPDTLKTNLLYFITPWSKFSETTLFKGACTRLNKRVYTSRTVTLPELLIDAEKALVRIS